MLCRLLHIRQHSAMSDTQIHTYYSNRSAHRVSSSDVTKVLRLAATACFHETGIPPDKISARSLRPGGATALLTAGVDDRIVRLMGRWLSDSMFLYLHTQVRSLTDTLAKAMLTPYKLPADANDNETPELLPENLPESYARAYFQLELEAMGFAPTNHHYELERLQFEGSPDLA